MNDRELIEKASLTGKYRESLYLAPSKIEDYFVQKVAAATELGRSNKRGGKLSTSLFSFLGAEASEEAALTTKISVTPMLQAIIAENAARESGTLIDLTSQPPSQGVLIFYVGPARFTAMNEPLVSEMTPLPAPAVQCISRRRSIQEEILRLKDDRLRTAVLVISAQQRVFAAIASTEFMQLNSFASYHSEERFGVLCTMEGSATQDVAFLNPMWIWYE
jgi:hypothetical protein